MKEFKQRYYYVFNGRWKVTLPEVKLYDIIDVVEDKIVYSDNSSYMISHVLKELNKTL